MHLQLLHTLPLACSKSTLTLQPFPGCCCTPHAHCTDVLTARLHLPFPPRPFPAVPTVQARGDIREIVGQPVFVPLYKLFLVYGKIFRLSFGPKTFVVISDPAYTRQILLTNADKYSKGLLSEILDFVMGQVGQLSDWGVSGNLCSIPFITQLANQPKKARCATASSVSSPPWNCTALCVW